MSEFPYNKIRLVESARSTSDFANEHAADAFIIAVRKSSTTSIKREGDCRFDVQFETPISNSLATDIAFHRMIAIARRELLRGMSLTAIYPPNAVASPNGEVLAGQTREALTPAIFVAACIASTCAGTREAPRGAIVDDVRYAVHRISREMTNISEYDHYRIYDAVGHIVEAIFEPFDFYGAKGTGWGFSNFTPCFVRASGLGGDKAFERIFLNSEALFQAYKSPDDEAYVRALMVTKTPSKAKQLGRRVSLRPDWEEVKVDCMRRTLRLKFEQNDDMRDRLFATGLRPLFEHTRRDTFWGDGFGEGRNMLGHLLTELKYDLLAEE